MPRGVPLSLLAAPTQAHCPLVPFLPLPACCTKGAFDLNLSARIRVQSCSPLLSTEPQQGSEATSATLGYSREAQPGLPVTGRGDTEVTRGSAGFPL